VGWDWHEDAAKTGDKQLSPRELKGRFMGASLKTGIFTARKEHSLVVPPDGARQRGRKDSRGTPMLLMYHRPASSRSAPRLSCRSRAPRITSEKAGSNAPGTNATKSREGAN
jgi:hypothetical protein